MIYGERSTIPSTWIGVEADWSEQTDNPLDCLVELPPHVLRTHALVLGVTGSGKTTLVHHLLAQDISSRHSFCVIDLRGDLVSAALELCAAGHIDPSLIRLIDLREKERPCGFDPLFGAGEPYFRALSVLDAVAAESDSWGVQLAETLRNGLMLLAEVGEPLPSLESLLYDRAFRLGCLEVAESESLLEFWHRFDGMSVDRQGALAMPVLNKLSLLLATKTLRAILGHPNPFDLGEHLNRPGSIVLVSLAADELHAAGRMMGSLVLASICREVFARVTTAEERRNPIRLYVDEFEHFDCALFESILAEGRRFRLSAVLAHQTLAQLSPKMRSLILGNVGVKVIFRCGRDDSTALNRDIFGDLKAFDFTALPVGVAVLWQRSLGAVEVEINEPLLKRVGALSSGAVQFRDAVCAASERPSSRPRCHVQRTLPPAPFPVRTSSLKDWLCD